MKYDTSTFLNNIGYDQLEADITSEKINKTQIEKIKPLLKQEQKNELIDHLWERAVCRLLDKDDVDIREYMNPTELEAYNLLTEIEDLPF